VLRSSAFLGSDNGSETALPVAFISFLATCAVIFKAFQRIEKGVWRSDSNIQDQTSEALIASPFVIYAPN
jgi:hypothetical protein